MKTLRQTLRIVDVDAENFDSLPCCGITDAKHPGRVAKRMWFREQLQLGLRAKALLAPDGKAVGYIEYIPGEHAWRGIDAKAYMFVHCLWVHARQHQRQGWGQKLLKACIAEARAAGMKGVAALARESPWSADHRIFALQGFEVTDTAPPDYELLVLRFERGAPTPHIRSHSAVEPAAEGLTIVDSGQCPYATKFAQQIAECARDEYGIKTRRVHLRRAHEAQNAPTPYAVFSILYDGRVIADHQISRRRFKNIMKKIEEANGSRHTKKKAESL